jgi:L-malate glycosyltransferase
MMNSPKIIFVQFYNNYSGSPHVLRTVIGSLSDYPRLLVTNSTDGFLSSLDITKVLFIFELSNSKVISFLNYCYAQFSIFYIVLKISKNGDIIYINSTVPMFASYAAKIKKLKIVFHLHENRNSLNVIHRLISSSRKYFCDFEIFVSKYLKIKEQVLNHRSHVLHNVLPQSFSKNAISYNSNNDSIFKSPFIVLMVCSLRKYKGVLEYIKIAETLLESQNIQFSLIVGDTKTKIEEFTRNIRVPSNMEIFPQTENTIPHYESASILVNLSRPDEWVETFGLTILEAMSFGLPCIVPPVGGPLELVEHGENGYAISSYETKRIANKIRVLYSDQTLYAKIAKNNRAKAKIFSISKYRMKIKQIINSAFEEDI